MITAPPSAQNGSRTGSQRTPSPSKASRLTCIPEPVAQALAGRQGPDGFRVVTAPLGAGKSVVADVLAGDFDPSALVGGDQFFGFLRRGFIPPWLPAEPDQNGVVIRSAASASGHLAAGGAYTVIYDGVIGPWFCRHSRRGRTCDSCTTRCSCLLSNVASPGCSSALGTGSPTSQRPGTCITVRTGRHRPPTAPHQRSSRNGRADGSLIRNRVAEGTLVYRRN